MIATKDITKGGKPTTLAGPIGQLAKRVGVRALAEELDCSPQTLGRWAKGLTRPTRLYRTKLAELLAAHGLPEPAYKER